MAIACRYDNLKGSLLPILQRSKNSPKATPPPNYFLQVFCPTPPALIFTQSRLSQAELQGGVIMTRLRALVGAYSALTFIGFVVAVPIAWAVVIGIGVAFPDKLATANVTFLR